MSKPIRIHALPPYKMVKEVYIGDKGECCCGCNGDYFTDAKTKKEVYALFAENLFHTYTYTGDEHAFVCLNKGKLTYTLYLKEKKKEEKQ